MVRLNLPRQRSFLGPAAIWKRVVAFILDFIIIDFVVFTPFRGVVSKLMPKGDLAVMRAALESSPSLFNLLMGILLIAGILAMLYFVTLERILGTTVGKRIMRIEVVSEGGLRLWQCLLRSIYLIPLFPLPLLWVADPVYMLFSHDNARLLERLSRTRTVERMVMT